METGEERKMARMSLLDASDGEEDGSRLSSPLSPRTQPPSVRSRKTASITVTAASNGTRTPPYSTSQRSHDPFADPDDASSLHSSQAYTDDRRTRRSSPRVSSEIPTSTAPGSTTAASTFNSDVQRRRGSSLSARWEGDETHRPLDIIRRESQKANRAPHLRKRAHHGADIIDKLPGEEGAFHHEGPYDVASLARNRRWKDSPLEAIAQTNREALKSVHREKVLDSIEKHRPLDGFAAVPPGMRDPQGRIFHYEEGTDMMRFNGADYRRWPGIDYHPDDLKGMGEPSFSLERALRAKQGRNPRDHRRIASEGGAAFEMSNRPNRTRSLHHPTPSLPLPGSGQELGRGELSADFRRSGSAGSQQQPPVRRRVGAGEVKRRPIPVDLLADDPVDDKAIETQKGK